MASAHRIVEVLDEKIVLTSPENGVTEVTEGSVEFDNVSFKYKEEAKEYALSDVTLKIKAGQTVGILGGTGSSKTTLVQLIPRLYDTSRGTRSFDLFFLRIPWFFWFLWFFRLFGFIRFFRLVRLLANGDGLPIVA